MHVIACNMHVTCTLFRRGISDLIIPRDSSIIKGPPPSNASLHDAYCKKSKAMPDFVAVNKLVEQQVDTQELPWSKRCAFDGS